MNIIVTEIIKIIKKSADAISREESLWGYLVDSFTQCIAEAFEAIDAELVNTYKAKGYQVERRDTRTIQCIFGAASFRRRLLKAPGKKNIYPLDVTRNCAVPALYALSAVLCCTDCIQMRVSICSIGCELDDAHIDESSGSWNDDKTCR